MPFPYTTLCLKIKYASEVCSTFHVTKHTLIHYFIQITNVEAGVTIIITGIIDILPVKKQRQKEVKSLARAHTAERFQSWDATPAVLPQ